MKLRILLEEKKGFLIYGIPSIKGDYKKQEQKGIRKKDLKSDEYNGFLKLLKALGAVWEEDAMIEFLYATVDFIYWDSKRGDYNYLNFKSVDDVFFKDLTHISYNNYKTEIGK